MDLSKFAGKTLDDAAMAELKSAFDELTGQRDAARNESIAGRKTLKSELAAAKAERDEAFAWAGAEDIEALRALPGPKGSADAARVTEAAMKKLTRERDEAMSERQALNERLAKQSREIAVANVLKKFPARNPDDVSVLFERHVEADGETFIFKDADGKVSSLDEGANAFFSKRPDYLLPAGIQGQGSGYRGTKQGAGEKPAVKPERKDFGNEVDFFKASAAFNAQTEAA